MQRFFSIGEGMTRAAETDDLSIELAFSSEAPYERWWGIEILDHGEQSVLLDRMNDGAPILFNHNPNDIRGTHEPGSVRLDKDRVMRGTARLTAATNAGREAIGLVQTKVLTKASVGYEILQVVEISKNKAGETVQRELPGDLFERVVERSKLEARGDIRAFQRNLDAAAGKFERAGDEPPTYRVTKWRPYENSLVTIPADNSVGIGRAHESDVDVRSTTATTAATQGDTIVSNAETAAAGASAETRQDSANLERLRIQTIHRLASQFKIPDAEREAWISEGVSIDDAGRKVLDVLAERGSRNPETSVAAIGLSAKETQQYSLFKAVRAVLDKNWSKAGLEFEAHKEIAKRTNAVVNENTFYVPLEVQRRPVQTRDISVSANGGGYLVETSNQGFIELLRNNSVAFRAGATRLSGLVGNVNIPKQSAAATAYWLANEATQITESQQTLVQVPLVPKTVGAYTEVSRLLLLQSSPDAEGMVMSDLAQVTAIAMDKAALHGSGGSGQPQGIVGSSGVGSVTCTSIGTDTYKKMLEFQVDLAAANALRGRLAYVTTPTVAGLLANYPRFASTDTPVWDGNLLEATMCGLPAFTSNQLEAGYAIFGNWADLIIGEWGVLAVEANPYANFQAGIVGIRAMYTVDIALRHGASFSVTTSVAA